MTSFSGTKSAIISAFILFLFLLILSACGNDVFTTNPKDQPSFSTDTLSFDTVFTSIGSATSRIIIYNRNNENINISNIRLAGGASSYFQINVDGSKNRNNTFNNIEIRARDSIYVFVQINVNPNNSNSPVFIQDSLMVTTNGVTRNLKLQAYGQNVKILKNKYLLNDTTLTAEKPYIIYGYLAVDTAKTLTIEPGCHFYFHSNANLMVYGNLKALGTASNPIEMRGDRLDKVIYDVPFPYNYVAGQWGGVYLLWKGGNHLMQHVNMNSGYVGVYYSNNDLNTLPNLTISDCKIQNFLLYGLVVQNGNITVTNSEISNTSSYTVYLSGGKHIFEQSTIANYFNNNNVRPNDRDKNPALMIMDLYRNAPMQSIFRNCIICGSGNSSSSNEFSLASRFVNQYKGIFDHCYIRKTDSLNLPQFSNIRWAHQNDTVFKNINYDYTKGIYFNFMPDSVSPVRGIADPTVAARYPLDLNGNSRLTGNKPDLGAYQWEPTQTAH